MFFLFKVSKYKILPVLSKHVFTNICRKYKSASAFCRLHFKMHFRIMSKGFKMAHTLYSVSNCLFINNISVSKSYIYSKTVRHLTFYYLNLNLSHHGNNRS